MATGDKLVNLDDLKVVYGKVDGDVSDLKSALNDTLYAFTDFAFGERGIVVDEPLVYYEFEIPAGKTIKIEKKGGGTFSSTWALLLYDQNKDIIDSITITAGQSNRTVTVNQDVAYVRGNTNLSESSIVKKETDGFNAYKIINENSTEIGHQASQISNIEKSLNGSYPLSERLVSGSYNSTGGVVINSKRIRTEGFINLTPNDEIIFQPSEKFRHVLYGTFTTSGVFVSDSPWLEGEQHLSVSENRKLILVFKSTPDQDIAPEDFDAICVLKNVIGATKDIVDRIKYEETFDALQYGMITTDGSVSSTQTYKYTPYIYVPLNDGGEIQVSSTIYGNASLAFYDIHKNVIEVVSGNNAASYGTLSSPYVLNRTFIAPRDTQYIRASIGLAYGSVSQFKLSGTGLADVYHQLNNRDVLSLNPIESMYVNAGANFGHHSNGHSNVDKRFTALITTDIHGDAYALDRAIKYSNLMKCFDCGITIGDLQTGTFSDNDGTWYSDVLENSKINWLTLVGNHDFGIGSKVTQTGTVEEVYEKFIEPNLQYAGDVVDSGHCYYYKDYTNYKLRLICLNPYDVNNNDTDGDGNYIVNRYTEYYSQTQVDWLISVLNNTPNDYQVVILSHSAPAETTKDESIRFNNRELGLPNEGTQTDLITDIINAWINGEAISATYTASNPHLSNVIVFANFVNRGNGTFVCYLTGHQHIDFVGHITKYTNQIILSFSSTCMDKYQNGGRIDLPRADNTKAEDCITSFSVDTGNKLIFITRIGSSMSKWFDKREPSVIPYGLIT